MRKGTMKADGLVLGEFSYGKLPATQLQAKFAYVDTTTGKTLGYVQLSAVLANKKVNELLAQLEQALEEAAALHVMGSSESTTRSEPVVRGLGELLKQTEEPEVKSI